MSDLPIDKRREARRRQKLLQARERQDALRRENRDDSFVANLSRAAGALTDQLSAAFQQTSPIVRDVQGNDIRPFLGKFFQDAGGPSFIDAQGQVQPINMDTMVMLPDPDTREILVFSRTPATDERFGAIARIGSLGAIGGTAPRAATAQAIQRAGTRGTAQALDVSEDTAAFLRQQADPNDLQVVLQAGEEAMPADAPSLTPILDAAAQRSGPVARQAMQGVRARAQRASNRIDGALDKAFGRPLGQERTRRMVVDSNRPQRNAAYQAAYETPINYASDSGQELLNVLRSRVPPEAYRRANALMRLRGATSPQFILKELPNGSFAVENVPNVEQIDYLTRALRDMAKSGEGAGALGGQTDFGAASVGLSRELRSRVKDLVPEYADALDTAALDIRRVEALQFGNDLLSPRTAREAVIDTMAEMGEAERLFVAQGVRNRIDETLANVRTTLSNPNADETAIREAQRAARELSSRANREKIQAVIGPRASSQLFADIDEASTAFSLQANIARNSRTAPRQALERMVGEVNQPTARELVTQGQVREAGSRALSDVLASRPFMRLGAEPRADQTFRDLVDVLVSQGPTGGANAFESIVAPRASIPNFGATEGILQRGANATAVVRGGAGQVGPNGPLGRRGR